MRSLCGTRAASGRPACGGRGTLFLLALFALVLMACGGPSGNTSIKNLPPAVTSTTVGPGDTLEITVHEETFPKEYKIQGDGTITFPYVGKLDVAGLEPNQIIDLIRTKLAEVKVRYNAIVSVIPRSYASKKIAILGQVQKPGIFPWNEGIKLLDGIGLAGGFNSIADQSHVTLRRENGKGKTVTVIVNVEAISNGQEDIVLQPGDSVKVDARVF